MRLLPLAVLMAVPAVLAHGETLDGFVTRDRLPDPESALLMQGGTIWEGTCQNCHGGNKLTGAPKITSEKAWAPRIAQGFDMLFDDAVEGFSGPKYTQMPSRGGNEYLSDDEVKAAVAFMVWASGGAGLATEWAASQGTE